LIIFSHLTEKQLQQQPALLRFRVGFESFLRYLGAGPLELPLSQRFALSNLADYLLIRDALLETGQEILLLLASYLYLTHLILAHNRYVQELLHWLGSH